MRHRLFSTFVLVAALSAGPSARGTTYCIDAALGSDAASGIDPACWRTLEPATSFAFRAGDRVLIGPGTYVFPTTGWYMRPGVSWMGADPYLTTVVTNTPAAVPFVRFRTGSNGSGPPTDLQPSPFGPDTVFSNMRIVNRGAATVGIDVRVTSGDASPTIDTVVIEDFPTGIALHPSSDERDDASTHAILTNTIIRGATDSGLLSFPDVFYSNAVTEASIATNLMAESTGVGARITTLVNDLSDASFAVASPVVTNATLAGGTGSAMLLASYYDDGSSLALTLSRAGTFGVEVTNSIFTASDRYGLEETSPFTEPSSVLRTAMGGNVLGDHLDDGTTPRAANPAAGNLSIAPFFVDLTGGDLHVLPGSPTIDRLAASESPADDVDGQARPQGVRADMGADELVQCASFAVITVNQAPRCTGFDSVLDASGSAVGPGCAAGAVLEWLIDDVVVGTGTRLIVNPRSDTTYTLRARCADPRLSACSDEAQATVLSSQGPSTASAGEDVDQCMAEGPVVIDLDGRGSVGTNLTYRWTTTNGVIIGSTEAQAELHLDLLDVTQVVTVRLFVAPAGSSCFSSDTMLVTLRPLPTAIHGGPYSVVDSGNPTDLLQLDGSASRGEGPLIYQWSTTLGTFQDTGTRVSSLANPIVVVPDAPGDQRGRVCLTVTAANGCAPRSACTRISVLASAVLPPNDVGPTLRVKKQPPTGVRLEWQNSPVDAGHSAADEYEVWMSSRACGPFTPGAPSARVGTGTQVYVDPILMTPPKLRYYVVRSVNDGGTSVPAAPDGSLCP